MAAFAIAIPFTADSIKGLQPIVNRLVNGRALRYGFMRKNDGSAWLFGRGSVQQRSKHAATQYKAAVSDIAFDGAVCTPLETDEDCWAFQKSQLKNGYRWLCPDSCKAPYFFNTNNIEEVTEYNDQSELV